MLAPRWLQTITYLAIINAVLVAASLVHRHLWANQPPNHLPDAARVSPATIETAAGTPAEKFKTVPNEKSLELSPQERLRQLAPPKLQSEAGPVAADDPLMAEIRKQVAEQFPGLDATTAEVAEASEMPSAVDLNKDLQSRFAAIERLSAVAQSLLRLSAELRASKQDAQADQVDVQVQQLHTTLQALLSLR